MTQPIIELKVKPENVAAHADIEEEMTRHRGAWYHFEVRYSGGNIVDFVVREFISYEAIKQNKDLLSHDH